MADRKKEGNVMAAKIAVIGGGNMGGGMVRGICRACAGENVTVYDHHPEKMAALERETGCRLAENEAQAVRDADYILLTVKPYGVEAVIEAVAGRLQDGQVLVSAAAGVSIAALEAAAAKTGRRLAVVRLMPNTPVSLGAGVVLAACGQAVTEQQKQGLAALLAGCGLLEWGTEQQLDAGMAISGCGPAYVYMLIEAMADGGVEIGLPREKAQRLAAQTLMGAAQMVLQTGQHPGALKDAVCSPGGCTIAGVAALEERGFRAAAAMAVKAADAKNRGLTK